MVKDAAGYGKARGTFFDKKFDLDFGGESTHLSSPYGSSWPVPSKVRSGLTR